jgi:hypothetical protein
VKIRYWQPGMTDKESKHLAYWERNVLALRYAEGWYNDDVESDECPHEDQNPAAACSRCEREAPMKPRFDGWRRVLSLEGGKITFHIPDDFDVGNLPEIERNWDGHTTEEKWRRVLATRGIVAP